MTNESALVVAAGKPSSGEPGDTPNLVILRRFPAWAVVPVVLSVGALLFLPAVLCPLFLDDYLQAAMIRGAFPAKRGPFDLYNFIDDSVRRALFEEGALPWWASPNIKLKFFRPLSSALRWLDHSYLRAPMLMHLHSLAWWVAASLAARVLFRRLFSNRIATLAFIVFALAPCHALPLAWLANREALVALTFSALGLAAYVRFRLEGAAWLAVVSMTFFALGMMSGEYALCITGYIVAFEVFRRGDTILRRAVGLVPFALPAGAYLVVRRLLDYGARGSGFYTDPFVDVLAFLKVAPLRFLTLFGDAWLAPDLDSYRPRWIAIPFVAMVVALAWVPVRRMLASLDTPRKNVLSFMVLGSALSLLPVTSVIPSFRLLEASMLGVAAGVATFLDFVWFPVAGAPVHGSSRAVRLTGFVALMFGFAHLVRGPVLATVTGIGVHNRANGFRGHADFIRDLLTGSPKQHLVFVLAPEETLFLPYMLMAEGITPPKLVALADVSHVLLLAKDEHTLQAIVPSDRTLVPQGEGSLFRDDSAPLRRGAWVSVNGMRATVLEVGEAGPTSARFAFDDEYDSPDLLWVSAGGSSLHTVDLPEPGFGLPVDR